MAVLDILELEKKNWKEMVLWDALLWVLWDHYHLYAAMSTANNKKIAIMQLQQPYIPWKNHSEQRGVRIAQYCFLLCGVDVCCYSKIGIGIYAAQKNGNKEGGIEVVHSG